MTSLFRYRQSFLGLAVALSVGMAACDSPAQENDQAGDKAANAIAGGPATVEDDMPGLPPEDAQAGKTPGVPESDVPPPPRAVFTDTDCDFEDWVGQPLDEAALKALGRPYRILLPDSMMTMDANPERVNVVHEKDGTVTRIWCG